jgi:hypothetical protein
MNLESFTDRPASSRISATRFRRGSDLYLAEIACIKCFSDIGLNPFVVCNRFESLTRVINLIVARRHTAAIASGLSAA